MEKNNNVLTTNETNFGFIAEALSINADVEKVGKNETKVLKIEVETKDENKQKCLVTRTLRNELAINTIVDIERMLLIARGSKIVEVVGFGRIESTMAEEVGLKKATDLLKAKFGNIYDENTIMKYYNIGRIFGTKSGAYKWRDGIDESVSVNNLDVVMSLVKDIMFELYETRDVQKLELSDIDNVFEMFYERYIISGSIHLNYTQSKLKAEIKALKHGIIDGDCKEISTDTTTENDDTTTENDDTTTENDDNSLTALTEATNLLLAYFHGNKDVEKAIAIIVKNLPTVQ